MEEDFEEEVEDDDLPSPDGPVDAPTEIKGSASLIKDYNLCHAKAYARITRQPQFDKGIAALTGSAVHEALEMYAKEQLDPQRTFENYLRKEAERNHISAGTKTYQDAIENGKKWTAAGIGLLDHKDKQGIPFWKKLDPAYVERPFTLQKNGFTYTGKIDLVVPLQPRPDYANIDYKGLALDTPIPTVDGWKTMGELQVGDNVFGSDGTPCTVTVKSQVHHKRCYQVIFDNGTSIICDFDHLWVIHEGPKLKKRIKTTEQIHEDLILAEVSGTHNRQRILNASALELPERPLELDPYVLGLWLGDGTTDDSSITSMDSDIFEQIEKLGFELGKPQPIHGTDAKLRTVKGIRKSLISLNVLGNKHIPNHYLRGSISQRLALLQGLMDSDGSYNKVRNQCVFSNTNSNLAYGVMELALSLGWRSRVYEVNAHGFGKTIRTFQTTFTPTDRIPFRLPRKTELVRISGNAFPKRVVITSVMLVETVPTQCIAVDSVDNTYLCGQQMIPTHNTGKMLPVKTTPDGKVNNFILDNDIQFDMYDWATFSDPSMTMTFGIWPSRSVWVHLRGQAQEFHPSGKRKALKDCKLPPKYDFPRVSTPESVEHRFQTVIEPAMRNMHEGRWSRNPGEHCMNICSYYDKDKRRCGAEIPLDGGEQRFKIRPTTEQLVNQIDLIPLLATEDFEKSKQATLKPYTEPPAKDPEPVVEVAKRRGRIAKCKQCKEVPVDKAGSLCINCVTENSKHVTQNAKK